MKKPYPSSVLLSSIAGCLLFIFFAAPTSLNIDPGPETPLFYSNSDNNSITNSDDDWTRIVNRLTSLAVTVSASMSDALTTDNNSNSQAEPGDVLTYTIVIQNSGDEAQDVVFDNTIDSNTTLVSGTSGSLDITPIARNDSYTATGNIFITVPAGASDVLANDNDPDGGSLNGVTAVQGVAGNVGSATETTATGLGGVKGSVTMQANGIFEYEPPPGFTGTDTFTYEVTDDEMDTDEATVTITVSDIVWFVDNDSGGSNLGTFSNPFTSTASLNSAQGASAPNPTDGDVIFVYKGSSNYNDGVNLQNNQVLLGQGIDLFSELLSQGITLAPFSFETAPSSPPSGSSNRPLITDASGNGITLAVSNTIKGLFVASTSGTGIAGSGVGNLVIDETGINGAGKAFDVNGGGTLNVDLDEVVVTSSASGGFSLQNAGGTTTLSNVGIETSGGTGLLASFNTGTLTVTGTTNQINSVNGVGLNITNTPIGSSGVTFESISASGNISGILLFETGSSGGLTVTGNGSTPGSGGTIQNTTGNGLNIRNTRDVAINFMNITNSGANGIIGSNLTNFILNGSTVENNGNEVNEGGLRFDENLLGTVTISNSTIRASAEHNIEIINTSSTALNLSITNSTISDTNLSGLGADGFLLETRSTANASVTITDATFSNNASDGMQISAIENSTAHLTVNETFGNTSLFSNGARGLNLSSATNASLTFDVSNTTFDNFSPTSGVEAINLGLVSTSTPSSSLSGFFQNNIISNSGGGVGVDLRGGGTSTLDISNNTMTSSINREVVDIITGDAPGDAATLNLTALNNTLTSQNSDAFFIEVGQATNACLNVRGNTATPEAFSDAYRFLDSTSGTLQLESSATDCSGGNCANATDHITSNNTGTPVTIDPMSLVTPGTCPVPSISVPKSLSGNLDIVLPDYQRFEEIVGKESGSLQAKPLYTASAGTGLFGGVSYSERTSEWESSLSFETLGGLDSNLSQTNVGSVNLRPVAFSGDNINVNLGNLDPGQQVTITYDASIDNPLNTPATEVSNQATISGSNFSNLLTDDPDTGAANDATVTPIFTSFSPDGNNILYVDQNVTGGDGSGSSWVNAIAELRDALSWAGSDWDGSNPPLKIWVADGIYLPTGDNTDRVATFQLVNNVEIYGGFDGGESSMSDRDILANSTILSGDIGSDDNPFAPLENTDSDGATRSETDHIEGDNSIHVVTSSGTDNTAILDGFTVTGGLANVAESGKEIGAGIINDGGNPVFSNLRIEGNLASESGGGIYNSNGNPNLSHIIFTGNSASDGGGIFNTNSSTLRVRNALMTTNASTVSGGAVYSEDSNLIFTNVTITDNYSVGNGGGLFVDQTTFNLNNSILWNNVSGATGNDLFNSSGTTTFNYSLYDNSAGAIGGNAISTTNSITGDPNFESTDLSNTDYGKLATNSQAIDAGENSLYDRVGGDVASDLDLAGNPRVFQESTGGIIDMGAYELQGVQKIIEFTKLFDDPVSPGGTLTLEFTINNKPNESLSDITFTDDLDAVLSGLVATDLPKQNVCGTGSQLSGTSVLTFTGASLAGEAQCTFEVTLQVPAGAAVGDYPNTTSTLTATGSSSGPIVVDPATDGLLISKNIIFGKEFTDDPVVPGNSTTLQFSIINNPSEPLTDLSFTDDLEAVLSGLVATGLPQSNICGAGSQLTGTSVLSFTGGSLPAEGSCTFDVTVEVPEDSPNGIYPNITSQLDGTSAAIGGDRAAAQPATDDLTVELPIISGNPGNFITTWKSDNTGDSNDNQITIPTEGTGYNYDLYWEDVSDPGINGFVIDNPGDLTITFPAAGTYRVEISGDFPRIYMNNEGDKEKIISIDQWGDIAWTSMHRAFVGASEMEYNAADAPDLSGVTIMTEMFLFATSFNGDLSSWDVSSVENMAGMFSGATAFNGDVSSWVVSSVENMSGMFSGAMAFNGDLSSWDVSSVENMAGMFSGATAFNGDVSSWVVSSVENMSGMFSGAMAFNGDVSNWDVSSVTTMRGMFSQMSFNGDLSKWEVGSVEDMSLMFQLNTLFTSDLSGWDVSSVNNMQSMFRSAISFDSDLSSWDVSGVTNMTNMLDGTALTASQYDATLTGWAALPSLQPDVPLGAGGLEYCSAASDRQSIIDTYSWDITGDQLNCQAVAFITTWKTDNTGTSDDDQITIPTEGTGYNYAVYWEDVTDATVNGSLAGLTGDTTIDFPAAGTYRVEISGDFPRIYMNNEGDKEKIISIDQWGDIAWTSMSAAFFGTLNLTYNAADAPDLSGVLDISRMFSLATSFNGDISSWDVSSIKNMDFAFSAATSFNKDLNSWDVSNVETMVNMFAEATSFNGNISDWDVSNVKNMFNMFFSATSFNQDLNWDVSSVTNMGQMFFSAFSFNGDISGWNVSSVTNMGTMFELASSFNGDIGNWDVSSVTSMSNMFLSASAFNRNLGDWNVSNVTSMSGGGMLSGSGLSAANYDATLTGWSALTLKNGVELGADGLEYCNAQTERQSIIDTYGWEITGDTFSCPAPTASDGRVLAANTTPYRFAGSDFNPEGLADAITIETLPGQGTLQFNTVDVNPNDEIPLADIDNNKLRWLPPGEYGYDYTSFEYRTSIIGDKASEDPYTMTIDLGSGVVELTGVEGWRFMTNPSDGDSFDALLGPIWTRGLAGSDDPGATFANLYTLDQPNYQWEVPSAMSNTTQAGQPFIVYVFSDDDDDGTPEGFPKTLISAINWIPIDGGFSFAGLGFDEDPANPENFYLLGNPHPFGLDICEMFDSGSSGLADNISVWDPSANGANGDYVVLSCSAEEVRIPPFQSFWVRTVAINPTLSVPESSYLSGTETGYLKEKGQTAEIPLISLNVAHRDQTFGATTRILFSEDATLGLDPWDAPKLSAEGLATEWLSFHSLDRDGKSYGFQSLPSAALNEQKLRIPLGIQTTTEGWYSLQWTLPESHLLNANYYLRDNETGDVIQLAEGSRYSFEISMEDVVQTKEDNVSQSTTELAEQLSGRLQQSEDSNPRFELLVAADGVDGLSELGAIPEDFILDQNYPNPFNPTTQISYQLPESVNVRLEVYDMTGRSVATLISGQVAAGRHTVGFDASGLSSGVYIYRLQAGSTIISRKLTILK